MKLFRNTSAVLVLTLFTGLAVFTAIQLGGRLFGTPTANAQTVTTQTAVGQSDSSGATDPYGQSSDGRSDYGQSSGRRRTRTATATRAGPAARAAARPTPARPPAAPRRRATPRSDPGLSRKPGRDPRPGTREPGSRPASTGAAGLTRVRERVGTSGRGAADGRATVAICGYRSVASGQPAENLSGPCSPHRALGLSRTIGPRSTTWNARGRSGASSSSERSRC